MLTLSAEIRQESGEKPKNLIKEGVLPVVLYGSKMKPLSLKIGLKEFIKAFEEAGESSLISLEIKNKKEKFKVLIYDVARDPLTGQPIHADFYQPILTEEVEAAVPIIFEGEPLAVKELGGTLVKEIQEIEVEALPEKLPREIKVNVERLKTFEDEILVKDLQLPEGVKIKRDPDGVVALVVPPRKEELEEVVEEKVEEPEGLEEKEEKEETEEEKHGT